MIQNDAEITQRYWEGLSQRGSSKIILGIVHVYFNYLFVRFFWIFFFASFEFIFRNFTSAYILNIKYNQIFVLKKIIYNIIFLTLGWKRNYLKPSFLWSSAKNTTWKSPAVKISIFYGWFINIMCKLYNKPKNRILYKIIVWACAVNPKNIFSINTGGGKKFPRCIGFQYKRGVQYRRICQKTLGDIAPPCRSFWPYTQHMAWRRYILCRRV